MPFFRLRHAALLALAALCACSAPSAPLQGVTATEQAHSPDKTIARAVRNRLVATGLYSPRSIQVASERGVVTLSGEVSSLRAEEYAVRLAAQTPGVLTLENRLKVAATPRSDRALLKDVETALKADATASRYDLRVTVIRGAVTLHGDVRSYSESQLAKWVVMSVRGVRAVHDEIHWSQNDYATDAAIAQDVRRRLSKDFVLDRDLVNVEVEDGVVALNGQVESLAKKNLARADAWVDGVEWVDASGLQVRPELAAQMGNASSPAQSDNQIAAAIEVAFESDARVVQLPLSVEVRDGVATIHGQASSLKEALAARSDAEETVGVRKVVSLVSVLPLSQPADVTIARRARALLLSDPLVDSASLDVSVHDGVVTLKGSLPHADQAWFAGDDVSRIKGVKGFNDRIVVTEEPSPEPGRALATGPEPRLPRPRLP